MSKSSTASCSCKAEITSLRKEVTALKKAITTMEKAVTKLNAPGKLRATKAVVDSLDVVDATGKVVASIDNKGNLFCLSVWASVSKNVRGVFLDGKTFRKISAEMLELIGPTGSNPGLVAHCWPNGGVITINSLEKGSKGALLLQGHGGVLIARDAKTGNTAAVITTNPQSGATVELRGTNADSKATAKLSISHLNGSGALSLTDAEGHQVGKLP